VIGGLSTGLVVAFMGSPVHRRAPSPAPAGESNALGAGSPTIAAEGRAVGVESLA
jgi:hypothetical protein